MNEGNLITESELLKSWRETLHFFDDMIENGHKVRSIRFLVRHIIDKGYSKRLVPGTSLFSLLISIPTNNTVDYSKTLQVSFNDLTQKVEFNYRNYTGLERSSDNLKKSLRWSEYCEQTEVVDVFEHFLMITEGWEDIINK